MVKVVVLGAGGGIGQPLSLLLKLSPLFDEIALYDRHRAPGVAVDLSHIPTKPVVKGYTEADDGLAKALKGADVIACVAGPSASAKGGPLASRNSLIEVNSKVIGHLINATAQICPHAIFLILSNPVNALVPLAAEILRSHGVFDANRLFGVTTLDELRAETFLARIVGDDELLKSVVPVVGGHSAETMIPLLSQTRPPIELREDQMKEIARRVLLGGPEVYFLKETKGGATLSTAFATFRLIETIIKALNGQTGLVACTYAYLPGINGGPKIVQDIGLEYYAVPIEFGPSARHKILDPLRGITEAEWGRIRECKAPLQADIDLGLSRAKITKAELGLQ